MEVGRGCCRSYLSYENIPNFYFHPDFDLRMKVPCESTFGWFWNTLCFHFLAQEVKTLLVSFHYNMKTELSFCTKLVFSPAPSSSLKTRNNWIVRSPNDYSSKTSSPWYTNEHISIKSKTNGCICVCVCEGGREGDSFSLNLDEFVRRGITIAMLVTKLLLRTRAIKMEHGFATGIVKACWNNLKEGTKLPWKFLLY